MKKDLIIFDLDGTLINTDTLYTLGWKTILKGYGIALPEATLAQMNGQSTEKNNEIVNSYLNSWERT
ncbi:HAD hydrolase-like protein, partial [Jeotgalibaca porci]